MKTGKIHIEELEGELKYRFLPPRYDLDEVEICDFNDDCSKKCFENLDCRVYKFYKKYGRNYRK